MNIKSAKKIALAVGGAAAAAGALAFLIAPRKAAGDKKTLLMGRNIAHRGLHKVDKSVPENSLPAFDAAARIGYGIELDVRLTGDGVPVVFHDEDTMRVCGEGGLVEDMTFEELSKLRLCRTEEKIPRLSEVLDLVDNRCPIVVELKRGGRNTELCEKTYTLLKAYEGRFCVESFDPRILLWFRRNAPEVLRGQLAASPRQMVKESSPLEAFLAGNLLLNFISRPHFIAYGIGRKPLLARLAGHMGAMRVAWTSQKPENEKNNDAVIFEYYRPRVKFK